MRREKALIAYFILIFLTVITIHCKKTNEQPILPPPPPPASPKPGIVKGIIANEHNRSLPGTVLNILGNGIDTTITTANGNYIFHSLKPGTYNLSARKYGYIETSVSVAITPGDTTTKDIVLKAGTAYFDLLSDSVIYAKPFANSITIKIASNTSWVVNNDNNWIVPDKSNSNGDDSIIVKVAALTTDTERQATFVLMAGSIMKTITVKQLPGVKLNQVIAIPGNQSAGLRDSIALVFNQPITVKSLIPGFSTCSSGIGFSYMGNKVTFSYACAALGGDYPFTIATNSILNDQYTFTFTAGFYEKAINLSGGIRSHFVNDADNSYWIITDHPNALYKIDMSSFQILHKYDLPEMPVMFTVSPYNNKIYLAYHRIPKLYILNQNGTTEQVVDITPDSNRTQWGSDGPIINPLRLAFTKNGKGMIRLSDRSQYHTGVWYIDAAADHRIWYESFPGEAGDYADVKANYDQTKLILTYVNDNPTIGIFDSRQMAYSTFRPRKVDFGSFVTPSRKNDNIYIGQLYFQSIADPGIGFETQAINKQVGSSGSVDFCYKPGKDQTVYLSESGFLQTVDYSTLKTPVKYDAINFLQGTTATLDGKHIILYRHDGNYNAKLVQLPTAWFDY